MSSFCNLCRKLGKSVFFDENDGKSEKSTRQIDHARIHYQQLKHISDDKNMTLETLEIGNKSAGK